MVNAGQLKAARTRAKKEIKKVADKINPHLAEMEQNISRASIEQIDQWEPFLGTNIPKLEGKLEILDQCTERLETFCQDTNNEAELQILNAELDAGDDMEEFRDMIFRLRDLRDRFTKRRIKLEPVDVNVPVARAGPTQDEMVQLMKTTVVTAVTTAMAQLVPQQNQQPAVNVPAAGAACHGAQAQAPIRVKLPKLELTKFSGDIMEWSGFWAQFSKAIDEVPNFPDIEKFQYLKAHLAGEALDTISGYKFTEANYRVVVDLLKERYAKNQPIIEAYYSALDNMSSTTVHSTQLRVFYNELERILRSLEALDQNVDHLGLLTIVKSKLPQEVLKSLEIHKPEADAWTMARVRQHLKRELTIRESLYQSQKTFNGSSNDSESGFQKHGGTRPKSNNLSQNAGYKPSPLKPSGTSLVAVEQRPKRNRSCIYCQGDHYADECTQFSMVEDRQNKLREENRCFSCFSPTHRSPSCPKKHKCFHCNAVGKHHHSLCIKKFSTKMQHKPGGGFKKGKGGSSFLSHSEKKDDDGDDSPDDTPITKVVIERAGISVSPSEDSQSLLASDESVIMQTAVLKVKNPANGSFEDTITMFDCGATHTYVTNDFAKEMNLPLGKKFSIPISTFGTEKVKSLTVYSSKLVIKLLDGSFMKLNIRVVPTLSGTGSKNNLCDQLNLFVDDLGLLRAHGRFENSTLSEAVRQPKLLPSKDHLTWLIIESVHRTFLHSGVSQTLASVRQEYWIPQGRSRICLVLSDCQICRRWMGGPYRLPIMAPWPKERMTQSPAFTVTGLDYFGPLYIKDNPPTTTKKVWVCLFTCIAVRAVHLELVDDMSSEHFLMCFQRFIACHGKPAQLISDNVTQFKLAKSTIDKAWENVLSDSSVVTYIANQGIRWKFIIQFAPWTGGFYERMVGVVKSSLRKSIGKICLTRTQLSTLLAEIQAVVNSRPLVYVNEDVNSDMALTLSHFLSLNPRNGVPSVLPNLDENDPEFDPLPVSSTQSLLLTWKKGQRHLERFWKLWKNDYLL